MALGMVALGTGGAVWALQEAEDPARERTTVVAGDSLAPTLEGPGLAPPPPSAAPTDPSSTGTPSDEGGAVNPLLEAQERAQEGAEPLGASPAGDLPRAPAPLPFPTDENVP